MNAAAESPPSGSPSHRHPLGRGALAALLASCVLVFGVGACSRTRLTPTHGRSFREAFAKQDANPGRKENKSINGLDSQEAAIIAGSYRKGLAPRAEATNGGNQLLMMSPNHGGGGSDSAALAPSVPSGN